MKKLTLPVYDINGESCEAITLDGAVFGVELNPVLVHQAVVTTINNRRTAIANTKDRSDVSGGGKKPRRQKGTGQSRAGSSRSPLWVGGGVTFGPTSKRNFVKRMPEKMKRAAWRMVLSQKLRDNQIAVVAELSLDGKTKSWLKTRAKMAQVVPGLAKKGLIIDGVKSELNSRSIRNLDSNRYVGSNQLALDDIINYPVVLFSRSGLTAISERLGHKTKKAMS